jgi:hypothetical protein
MSSGRLGGKRGGEAREREEGRSLPGSASPTAGPFHPIQIKSTPTKRARESRYVSFVWLNEISSKQGQAGGILDLPWSS